jgi:hypothetical protein
MTGHWVERALAWNETAVLNCAVCGRLITRRAWVFDGGAGDLQVCSPECEELYESYYVPTHGVISGEARRTKF